MAESRIGAVVAKTPGRDQGGPDQEGADQRGGEARGTEPRGTEPRAAEARGPEEVIRIDPGIVRLRVTPRLWSILERHRISFGNRGPANLTHLDLPKNARIEQYADYTNGLTMHSMGAFSYSMTGEAVLVAGRYCSIADHTCVMGERHPVEHVTSSTFPYRAARPSFRWARQDLLGGLDTLIPPTVPTRQVPVLEHDVWTGTRVILARGITLHTGCIAAAGAVVTKDVPPYAIVGGNPAQLIRMRFSDKIIERMLASQWWTLHPRVLFDCDIRYPERFLDQVEAARAERFEPGVFSWRVLAAELGI
jgi:acetyltransferase-like isoleucine patch superfamily enzyme